MSTHPRILALRSLSLVTALVAALGAGWKLERTADGSTISGRGTNPDSNSQRWIAFLGTPVPEPSTLLLAALALVPFGRRSLVRRNGNCSFDEAHAIEVNSTQKSGRARRFVALQVVCCASTVLFLNIQPSYAAKFYWTSTATGKIQRSNLDGSQIEDVVTGLSGNYGLAVDDVHGRVYWSSIGAGTISRANLDGTGKQTLLSGLNYPLTIRLDVPTGLMYWKDNLGTHRATLDGANGVNLVAASTEGQGLAIDTAQSKMYLSSWPAGNLQRANLDGSGLVNLVARPGTEGVELDSIHSKLYLVNYTQGTIGSTELDGTGFQLLVSGQSPVEQVALDVAGGKMYWGGNGSIRRANLDGTSGQILIANAPSVDTVRLVLDNVPESSTLLLSALALVPMVLRRSTFDRRTPR